MMILIKELIQSNKSIKDFRGALLEASHRFSPGSAASALYYLYKEVSEYYSYLLGHSFQLYSDRPRQFFNLAEMQVDLTGDVHFEWVLSKGNNNSMGFLSQLNDVESSLVEGFSFRFILSPPLQHLRAEIEACRERELFYREHDSVVSKGDGTTYKAIFKPEWSDQGVLLRATTIQHESDQARFLLKL